MNCYMIDKTFRLIPLTWHILYIVHTSLIIVLMSSRHTTEIPLTCLKMKCLNLRQEKLLKYTQVQKWRKCIYFLYTLRCIRPFPCNIYSGSSVKPFEFINVNVKQCTFEYSKLIPKEKWLDHKEGLGIIKYGNPKA